MKSQKGQSLVETALILPILLLLVFGITDFGRIFHAYLTLDHAGREAARVASIGSGLDDVADEIKEATSTLESNDSETDNKVNYQIICEETKPNECTEKPNSGEDVIITLTYPVDFLTPVIGQIIEEFDLKDTTVMRVE